MNEPLLLKSDVARRLNVSIWMVRKLLRTGQLRGLRIGRVIRIEPAALKQYLDLIREGKS